MNEENIMTECPCRITYEDVRAACNFLCPAPFADESGNICGKPLGAHPHQQSSVKYFILLFFILSNVN